jgi:hypothetical protein
VNIRYLAGSHQTNGQNGGLSCQWLCWKPEFVPLNAGESLFGYKAHRTDPTNQPYKWTLLRFLDVIYLTDAAVIRLTGRKYIVDTRTLLQIK